MANFKFKSFGVMIDCSRNAVMSPNGLKRYLPLLKKMGYNCVMLYTEDTYEVADEPYFGYMRGRYTCEELRELDEYAAGLGIELIPCIQTLAHLQGFVPWKQVPIDNEDAMLVDEAIRRLHPDADAPVFVIIPVSVRRQLGCGETFKNCSSRAVLPVSGTPMDTLPFAQRAALLGDLLPDARVYSGSPENARDQRGAAGDVAAQNGGLYG